MRPHRQVTRLDCSFQNDVGVSGGTTTGGASTFYSRGQDTLLVDLGADASTSSMAFSLGSIPGLIDLDARLSAMETDGWGKVVSEPRITTLDNQQAVIQQGSQIPFLSTSSGGTQVQLWMHYQDVCLAAHHFREQHFDGSRYCKQST